MSGLLCNTALILRGFQVQGKEVQPRIILCSEMVNLTSYIRFSLSQMKMWKYSQRKISVARVKMNFGRLVDELRCLEFLVSYKQGLSFIWVLMYLASHHFLKFLNEHVCTILSKDFEREGLDSWSSMIVAKTLNYELDWNIQNFKSSFPAQKMVTLKYLWHDFDCDKISEICLQHQSLINVGNWNEVIWGHWASLRILFFEF